MRRAAEIAASLPFEIDLDEMIMGRAALNGFTAQGRISANGSCRLLRADDGWMAVNLSRSSDLELLPAVLRAPVDPDDPWPAMGRYVANRDAVVAVDRFQLLGIPAAVLADPNVDPRSAVVFHDLGRRVRRLVAGARVVDLSSMWAGPLCAHLLGRAGLDVTKVESVDRPDGARFGEPRFFERLHAGHQFVTLELRDDEGREELRRLVAQADVVIESSRPRALSHLGVDAAETVAARPGVVWVSITGYGRSGPYANRVAFGDDAAVAGGLVSYDDRGLPVFCADAIADPMSGLVAAAAALRSINSGGGQLVEVAMAAVAASLVGGTS